MGQIEPIIDYELAEQVKFYGTLIGTTGMSEDVLKLCNKNLLKLLQALQPGVDKLTAKKSGLITK